LTIQKQSHPRSNLAFGRADFAVDADFAWQDEMKGVG
jgi:hypothetical protein